MGEEAPSPALGSQGPSGGPSDEEPRSREGALSAVLEQPTGRGHLCEHPALKATQRYAQDTVPNNLGTKLLVVNHSSGGAALSATWTGIPYLLLHPKCTIPYLQPHQALASGPRNAGTQGTSSGDTAGAWWPRLLPRHATVLPEQWHCCRCSTQPGRNPGAQTWASESSRVPHLWAPCHGAGLTSPRWFSRAGGQP